MSKWYPQEAADKLIADINAALAEFQKSGMDLDVPAPLPPPNDELFVPAYTDAQAVQNANQGFLMDGRTKSTDSEKTLTTRQENVTLWNDHVNLVGIDQLLKEYGILIGQINDISPFGMPTGNPIAPSNYAPPATLQGWVDAALNPSGGPSGG